MFENIIGGFWDYLLQLNMLSAVFVVIISLVAVLILYFIYGVIPAAFIWRRVKKQLIKDDLVLISLLALIVIFLGNYLFTLLQINNLIISLVGLLILILFWQDKKIRQYLLSIKLNKRDWVVILLILLFSLSWSLPSILSGLSTKEGGVLFSPSLGGERILFTAYGQSALDGIPPAHPYWANYDLSYHYFGMMIQNFFVRFGLDAIVVNFMILPTLVALICGLAIWQLARRYTNYWFALAAPIVFFLWDNLSWLLPASMHYPDRPQIWWLTPFQAQHHVYINGQSYHFAALFVIAAIFLLQEMFSAIEDKKQKGYVQAILLGMVAGSLILIKVQAFMVVAGGFVLWQIYYLLRRESSWSVKKAHLKPMAVFWLVFCLMAVFFVYTNRNFLLVPDSGNLAWRPFDEVHTTFDAMNREDTFLGTTMGQWTDYLALPKLTNYKPLSVVLVSTIIFTFGASLIGLGAIFFSKLRKSPVLIFAILSSLIAIFAMYFLYVGGGNQWQFSYAAYPLLSVLVAVTLYQFSSKWRWLLLVIFTTISIPTMWGQFTMYIDGYIQVPETDIQLMTDLANKVDKGSSCLLALPRESDVETNQEMDIINQIREVIFPVYADCNLVASYGPRTAVNTRTDQGVEIFQGARQNFIDMQTKDEFVNLAQSTLPDYIWIAKNNLYGVETSDLADLGYTEVINSIDSGIVVAR